MHSITDSSNQTRGGGLADHHTGFPRRYDTDQEIRLRVRRDSFREVDGRIRILLSAVLGNPIVSLS